LIIKHKQKLNLLDALTSLVLTKLKHAA